MHRQKLLQLLNNYNPSDTQERINRKQMIAFIQKHPRCFDRELEIGHITASSWLINRDGTQALLTHHAKLHMWMQLGGHCDGNSDVLSVSVKEAQEESGIQHISPIHKDIFDIDIHFIPAHKQVAEHYHYDVRFLLQVTSDEQYIVSEESIQLQWVGQDPLLLPTPTDYPSIMRMFNKWVAL